jgi:hypothetical protein
MTPKSIDQTSGFDPVEASAAFLGVCAEQIDGKKGRGECDQPDETSATGAGRSIHEMA